MDELESTNKSTREKALTNIWLIICGFSLNPKITGKMDDILLLLKSGQNKVFAKKKINLNLFNRCVSSTCKFLHYGIQCKTSNG